jgi:hypothetical protein
VKRREHQRDGVIRPSVAVNDQPLLSHALIIRGRGRQIPTWYAIDTWKHLTIPAADSRHPLRRRGKEWAMRKQMQFSAGGELDREFRARTNEPH